MSIALVRRIIYVREVAVAKAFYQTHFAPPVIEEITDQWVVLAAGQIELALHLMGDRDRQQPSSPASNGAPTAGSTTKLVFAIASDLAAHREQLRSAGVRVDELKRDAGFAYQMYDGRDPEGNVFQVMRPD